MLTQIISFLLGTVTTLFAAACLARLWLQRVRAPFANPVGQAVLILTGWAVIPLRRVIPGVFGIDLASAVAAWLAHLVQFSIVGWLSGFDLVSFGSLLTIAWTAFLATVQLFIYLLIGIVIVAAVLSWIAPYAPAAPLFEHLAAPLMKPLRRFMPVIGGLDFTPLIVILLLQVVLIVLEHLR